MPGLVSSPCPGPCSGGPRLRLRLRPPVSSSGAADALSGAGRATLLAARKASLKWSCGDFAGGTTRTACKRGLSGPRMDTCPPPPRAAPALASYTPASHAPPPGPPRLHDGHGVEHQLHLAHVPRHPQPPRFLRHHPQVHVHVPAPPHTRSLPVDPSARAGGARWPFDAGGVRVCVCWLRRGTARPCAASRLG